MAKFTFAIMGATGHIGKVLTEELLKKGHKVRALGRDKQKLQELKAKGAEIFSGDFTDHSLLSKIFKGCNAVFSFLPPALNATDFEVFRDKTSDAIAQAVVKAKISHVLNLSSIGAHLTTGTGAIKELHLHEQRLDSIPDVNVLHFRPGYFMENLAGSIPSIKGKGVMSGLLKADLLVGMVATRDIALKIAEFLHVLKFKGSSVFEFVGPKALTMAEAAQVIGKAVGKPDLKYVQISYQQAEDELIASGMKHQIAKLMVDMHKAFNEGKIMPTQELTSEHKGKTSFEEFCKQCVNNYRSANKAA